MTCLAYSFQVGWHAWWSAVAIPAIVYRGGIRLSTGQVLYAKITAYVVVRTALARREHSVVHALLEVLRLLRVLPEEDQAGTGATERLMSVTGESASRIR